jgi:hypothetical protein
VREASPPICCGARDWSYGDALTFERRFGEAVTQFRKAIASSNLLLGDLGFAYGASGDSAGAERYLHELAAHAKHSYVDPYERALTYAGMRRKGDAMRWLEQGFAAHSPQMIWLRSDPMLDGLRSDPRFVALVGRVGL